MAECADPRRRVTRTNAHTDRRVRLYAVLESELEELAALDASCVAGLACGGGLVGYAIGAPVGWPETIALAASGAALILWGLLALSMRWRIARFIKSSSQDLIGESDG